VPDRAAQLDGSSRPTIVLTGASGFLGRRLVRTLAAGYRVVAIDRQPRSDAGFDDDPNIVWHRIDLADPPSVERVFGEIRDHGGALAVIHLAAYYNFTDDNHAEYRRANVDATRLVVEASLDLGVELFVFASSVAACGFSRPGRPITEASPPDGRHIYAVTKAAGEELLREVADRMPSVIIRFAALFSDWCEYPPLYFFLETWLSDRWNARALGGRGATSLPFLHVDDAVPFVLRVLERRHRLDPAEVVIASVDGAVTHRQLFDVSTEYAFRSRRRPWHVPKPLAFAGTWARDLVGRVTGNRPFERPWMARFIDTEMVVDASRTRERLDWAPRERLEILRRIRFMIENARTSRMEWRGRNLDALEHHELRPRFRVYRLVRKLEAEVERRFGERLDALGEAAGDRAVRERTRQTALRALVHSVRTGEKSPFTSYCQALAERQLERGAPLEVVVATVRALEASCLEVLGQDPDAADLGDVLRDAFELTAEFGIDRIHEVYESAPGMAPPSG
jgi:nucleoside-diphosphate-sugar epimerase